MTVFAVMGVTDGRSPRMEIRGFQFAVVSDWCCPAMRHRSYIYVYVRTIMKSLIPPVHAGVGCSLNSFPHSFPSLAKRRYWIAAGLSPITNCFLSRGFPHLSAQHLFERDIEVRCYPADVPERRGRDLLLDVVCGMALQYCDS